MKKEEMAKAYAEGFAKEYREIAYDAFLCGYDAKCSTETPNDLEEAAVDIADALLAKSRDYILSAEADYWNGAHDGIIAGAKWDRNRILAIIKSRLSEIIGDAQPKPALRAELEELINKIKK